MTEEAPEIEPAGPLRREVLQSLRDLYPDGHTLREFIDLFLADSPPRLEHLLAAARSGNADAVWQGAHGLRGSCVLVGAHRMETLLEGLEASVRRGELPAETDLSALSDAYEDAAAALLRDLGDA